MTTYIIKSSVSLLLLFGLYWFLLRKEKLFVFNRFFLVASVVFSLLVPFISIPVNFQSTPKLENFIPAYNHITPEIITADNVVQNAANNSQVYTQKETPQINLSVVIFSLYFSGVLLFLIRFLRNLFLIAQKSRLSEKVSYNGFRIILTNDQTGPCCFFDNIFLNRNDYNNGRIDKDLLNHEMEHARQSHTIDIILIELVKVFYWFNPVYLLYERAIKINHEYLADNGVISDNSDIKSYADKLLNFITCSSNMSLTSGSNNSFTKMRLMMMMKSHSGSFKYGARIAFTLCMVTIFFLLLSFKESSKSGDTILSQARTEIMQKTVKGRVLNEEGKPLKEASIVCISQKNSSSGATTDSNGNFTLNDVQTEDSLVIGCFGYVKQTIKPEFASVMTITMIKAPNFPEIKYVYFRNSDFTPSKAIVSINGVGLDYKGTFKVNLSDIKSFKILKDSEAIQKYGEKGKDGVFEIILYGNQPKSRTNGSDPDTSKYITLFSINNSSNKGGLIDIPVSNLYSASEWIYPTIPNKNKKLRTIGITTRDFYKVKGMVVNKNGVPLSGVSISVPDNRNKVISDKNGRFLIEDVRENTMLEFSLPEYKPYYLATGGAVFTTEMKIELEKDNVPEKDVYVTAEKMPQYPGGEMELKKFIAMNLVYPEAAKLQKVEGVVIVRFVVNTKGDIEDVKIIQRVHPAIDTEVLRIVGKLERFIPGSQGGKPVDVYYNLPITFGLPKMNTSK